MLSFCLLLDISHLCQPSVPTYIICQNFNNENEIDKHKFEYSLVLTLVYYNHFLHGHFRKRNFIGISSLKTNETFWTFIAPKNIFSFSKCLKRWLFRKNCTGIWSFLYYHERRYFFFPKIWPYSLDRKWKMIFLKKNYVEIYGIFFKCSEKMVFPKKLHCNMIFLILSGKMVFLFLENVMFFFRR